MTPAAQYSHITGKVAALIAEVSENDLDRAAERMAVAA